MQFHSENSIQHSRRRICCKSEMKRSKGKPNRIVWICCKKKKKKKRRTIDKLQCSCTHRLRTRIETVGWFWTSVFLFLQLLLLFVSQIFHLSQASLCVLYINTRMYGDIDCVWKDYLRRWFCFSLSVVKIMRRSFEHATRSIRWLLCHFYLKPSRFDEV